MLLITKGAILTIIILTDSKTLTHIRGDILKKTENYIRPNIERTLQELPDVPKTNFC
jgi:hypothetical protein